MGQEQIGNILGKKKAVVSQYESGKTLPPADVLIKLAQTFEISVDDLLLRDIEKDGTSVAPMKNASQEEILAAVLVRMEKHVAMLEEKIRKENPGLARELGLE